MSKEQEQKQGRGLEGLSFDPDQLDHLSDWMTCQKECQEAEIPLFESVDPIVLLNIFRIALNNHKNPISPEILSSIESLTPYLTVKRVDITEKYRLLVDISGDDFCLIRDVLVSASKSNVDALYWSINSALISYQSALSKNASTAIADIANTATSLVVMLEQSDRQHTYSKKSFEDLAVTFNTMSTAMENYMREVDIRRLQNTSPKRLMSAAATAPPSVDSQARSMRQTPAVTSFVPGNSNSSVSEILIVDDELSGF